MISNSYDYDYASQQEEIIRRRDMKPKWFEYGQTRQEWEASNNRNGNYNQYPEVLNESALFKIFYFYLDDNTFFI